MALFNTLKTVLTPYAEKINKHTTDISILSEDAENVRADLNEAVDSLNGSLGDVKADLGTKGNLDTTDKSNLVNALNEVYELFTAPTIEAVANWLDEHPEATTTVQDGSLTYKKLATGTLGFVTPEMFGAVGDGTVVDSEAINSAILKCAETGLPLYLTGNYLVDYERPIVFSNITDISVVGKNAVIKLKDQTSISRTGRYYLFEIIGCSNVEISGVTFNGNRENLGIENYEKPNHLANGIFIKLSTNIKIHDCEFFDFSSFGIYCMSSKGQSYIDPNISELYIHHCRFESCMNAVKILEGISGKINFSDNVCLNMDTHGISFYPTATDVIVCNNIIDSGNLQLSHESGCGIRLYETNNVVCTGNIILKAYVAGIIMEVKLSNPVIPSNIVISKNQIMEVTNGAGIHIKGSKVANISENIINNALKQGIYLIGDNCIVSNNALNNITSQDAQCIVIFGSDNKISENTINNGGSYGIRLASGSNNIVVNNTIKGGNSMISGVIFSASCIIGRNYISNYTKSPYFENVDSVQYSSPKIIHVGVFDIDTGTSDITGKLDSGFDSIKITNNCTLLSVDAHVDDLQSAGDLLFRIYKNGTLLPAEITPSFTTEKDVNLYAKKGRVSPYESFLFDKGDVLTIKCHRSSSYVNTSTKGCIRLVFDQDR